MEIPHDLGVQLATQLGSGHYSLSDLLMMHFSERSLMSN